MIKYTKTLPLCLVVLLAACEDRTPPTPESQAIRPAKLHSVTDARQTIKRDFVGKVEALRVVDISFEVAGPLVELPILEGQEIAAGALLAALDPRDFELAVKEAEVQVKLATMPLQSWRGLVLIFRGKPQLLSLLPITCMVTT